MIPLLDLTRLQKQFGDRLLLDIASLSLVAGKAYVLTGDNGSGKSTLLRILAGLEPARQLVFRFGQHTASEHSFPNDLRREIVYVHQHPYLFNTSVAGNIEYGLKVRGISNPQRLLLRQEALQWAGLQHLSDVPPGRLSGGEKQRLALARARVLSPRLLLADEPTANLDHASREQVLALLSTPPGPDSSLVIACHDREIIDLPGIERLHLENGQLNSA